MTDDERKVVLGPLSTAGLLGVALGLLKRSRKLAALGIGALALDRLPQLRRLNERLGRKAGESADAAEAGIERHTP